MKLVGASRERAQFSISCLPRGARLEGQQLIRRFAYHDDKRGHRKASAKTQEHFRLLFISCLLPLGFPGGSDIKNLPAMQETWFHSLGGEDSLEKGMATHSTILAWRIPWTEEPDGLQSMGSQRARTEWLSTHSYWPKELM